MHLCPFWFNGHYNLSTCCNVSKTAADLWALAGLTAVSYSAKLGTTATLPAGVNSALSASNFKWGRKSCATSPEGA